MTILEADEAQVDDLPLPESLTEAPAKPLPDLMSYRPHEALGDLRLIMENLSLKDGERPADNSSRLALAKKLETYLANPTPLYIAVWGHATLTQAETQALWDWLKAMTPTRGQEAMRGAINGLLARATIEGKLEEGE